METERDQLVRAQVKVEVWAEEVDGAEVAAFLLVRAPWDIVSARAVVQRFLIRLGHHAVL